MGGKELLISEIKKKKPDKEKVLANVMSIRNGVPFGPSFQSQCMFVGGTLDICTGLIMLWDDAQ